MHTVYEVFSSEEIHEEMADGRVRVVEFYSGIGGMHFAINATGLPYKILAAMELNDVANRVYAHNFPQDNLIQKNIEGLTVKEMEELNADVILMSPPCQPFTRVGNQKASDDPRTRSFLNILRILESMSDPPKYILLENVKGFEASITREQLVGTLEKVGYSYQEFLISPKQFGIPNSRLRYYLVAKLKPLKFTFKTSPQPMESMPESYRCKKSDCDGTNQSLPDVPKETSSLDHKADNIDCKRAKQELCDSNDTNLSKLSKFLEQNEDDDYQFLSEEILGRLGTVLDIVTPSSTNSCCFTKAYGTYVKGTGSVMTTDKSEVEIKNVFESIQRTDLDDKEKGKILRELNLRYFSPREIANLMCFPKSFGFPLTITRKQRYKLLGNSINVHVVAELLKQCLLTEYT